MSRGVRQGSGAGARPVQPARRGWAYGLSAAALVAVGLGLVSWLQPLPAAREATRQAQRAAPSAPPAQGVARAPAQREPSRDSSKPSGTSPPIIDEVLLEKTELCAGEETLATVRAHTVDGTDAELHYLVGPGTGQSVPLRLWGDAQGNPPALQVTAFGKGNVATTVALPAPRLKPCRVDAYAVLSHRILPNRWGTYELRAQLLEPGRPPGAGSNPSLEARRYVWSFGDGTHGETNAGEVTHSYEDRPQLTLYSQFTARVEVVTRSGRRLVARDSLQLINPAYESWTRKGIVSLMVSLEPAFPVLAADGVVEQGVRLRHHRPDPVLIESVQAVRTLAQGSSTRAEAVDVVALLGSDTIAPGSGLELKARLDTHAEPGVSTISYYLKGKSAEGKPVLGSFSVLRPPPRPTADTSTPVTDSRLVAKIRRARARLGKDVVSEEDLARLERQGEFRDL